MSEALRCAPVPQDPLAVWTHPEGHFRGLCLLSPKECPFSCCCLLQIYNYYDTCYGTSGITMDANTRTNLAEELFSGTPLPLTVECTVMLR